MHDKIKLSIRVFFISIRAFFISICAFFFVIYAFFISICAFFLFERSFEIILEDYSYLIFHFRFKFDFFIQQESFCWRYSINSVIHVIIRDEWKDKVLIEYKICIFERIISRISWLLVFDAWFRDQSICFRTFFCLSSVCLLHEISSSNRIDQNLRFRNIIWSYRY